MRLDSLVTGLARKRSGLALLTGLSTMLTGIERLLSTRPRKVAVSPMLRNPERSIAVREHYFTIRQTRSEVGFVYWVLQGFGCFQSFSLHDTWQEAMEEANRRIADQAIRVPEPVLNYEYAL